MIGFHNFNGHGNNAEAERKFSEARRGHQAGDPRATRALAYCYIAGYGIRRSLDMAAELLNSIKEFEGAKMPYRQRRPDKTDGIPNFLDALRMDFKPLSNVPLPISGGWGYSKDDAIVINPSIDDPTYTPGTPFDFDGLKKLLITHRIYEECTIRQFDPLDGLTWELDEHEEINDAGRFFEHTVFSISGFPSWVWNSLRDDWVSSGRHLNSSKTRVHGFLRQWFVKSYKADYWFDISSSVEDNSQQNKDDNEGP